MYPNALMDCNSAGFVIGSDWKCYGKVLNNSVFYGVKIQCFNTMSPAGHWCCEWRSHHCACVLLFEYLFICSELMSFYCLVALQLTLYFMVAKYSVLIQSRPPPHCVRVRSHDKLCGVPFPRVGGYVGLRGRKQRFHRGLYNLTKIKF